MQKIEVNRVSPSAPYTFLPNEPLYVQERSGGLAKIGLPSGNSAVNEFDVAETYAAVKAQLGPHIEVTKSGAVRSIPVARLAYVSKRGDGTANIAQPSGNSVVTEYAVTETYDDVVAEIAAL